MCVCVRDDDDGAGDDDYECVCMSSSSSAFESATPSALGHILVPSWSNLAPSARSGVGLLVCWSAGSLLFWFSGSLVLCWSAVWPHGPKHGGGEAAGAKTPQLTDDQTPHAQPPGRTSDPQDLLMSLWLPKFCKGGWRQGAKPYIYIYIYMHPPCASSADGVFPALKNEKCPSGLFL